MRAIHRTPRRLAAHALLLAVIATTAALAGCGDAVGPGRDFLIRTPSRYPAVAPPEMYFVSPFDPTPLVFEWEPAPGATSYTVVVWPAESEAHAKRLEADFSQPMLAFEVKSPRFAEVPVISWNPNDTRTVRVVQHEVPGDEVAALLEAAGAPPYDFVYGLLSVFAENGTDRWRSLSLQPVSFMFMPD